MEAGDISEWWPEAMDPQRKPTTVLVRQPSPAEDTDLEVEMIAESASSPYPFAEQSLLNVGFQPIRLSERSPSPRPSYADVASGRVSPSILDRHTPSPHEDDTKEQLTRVHNAGETAGAIGAAPANVIPFQLSGHSRDISPAPSTLLNFGSAFTRVEAAVDAVAKQESTTPKKPPIFQTTIETSSEGLEPERPTSPRPTYAEVLLSSLGLPSSSSAASHLKRSLTPEPFSRSSPFIDNRRRQRSVSPRPSEQNLLKRSSRSAFVEIPAGFKTPTSNIETKTKGSGRKNEIRHPEGIEPKFEKCREKSNNKKRSNLTSKESSTKDEVDLSLAPADVYARHSVWLAGVDSSDAEPRFFERGGSSSLSPRVRSKDQFDTDIQHLTTLTQSIERQIATDSQSTTPEEILKSLLWELQTLSDQSEKLEIDGKELQAKYPEITSDLSHLKSIAGKLKELQMQVKRKQYGQQQEAQRRSLVLQELEDWLCGVRIALSGPVTELSEKTSEYQEIQRNLNTRKTQLEELIRNVDPSKPSEQNQLKGVTHAMTELEKQLQEVLQELSSHSMQMISSGVPSFDETALVATSTAMMPPIQVGDSVIQTLPDGSSVFSRQQVTSTSVQGSMQTTSVTSRSVTSGNLLSAEEFTSLPEVHRAMLAERFVRESSSQPEEETIVEEIDGVRRVTVRRTTRVVRQHVVRQRVQVQRMQRRVIYVNGEEVVTDEPDNGEGVEISEWGGDSSHLHLPLGSGGQRSPSPMVHFPRTPTPGSPSEERTFFSIGQQSESPRTMRTPSPGSPRTPRSQEVKSRTPDKKMMSPTVSVERVSADREGSAQSSSSRGYSPQMSVEIDKRSSDERSRSESIEMELPKYPQDENVELLKAARKKHVKKKKKIGGKEITMDVETDAKVPGIPPVSPSGVSGKPPINPLAVIGKPPMSPSSVRKTDSLPKLAAKKVISKTTEESESVKEDSLPGTQKSEGIPADEARKIQEELKEKSKTEESQVSEVEARKIPEEMKLKAITVKTREHGASSEEKIEVEVKKVQEERLKQAQIIKESKANAETTEVAPVLKKAEVIPEDTQEVVKEVKFKEPKKKKLKELKSTEQTKVKSEEMESTKVAKEKFTSTVTTSGLQEPKSPSMEKLEENKEIAITKPGKEKLKTTVQTKITVKVPEEPGKKSVESKSLPILEPDDKTQKEDLMEMKTSQQTKAEDETLLEKVKSIEQNRKELYSKEEKTPGLSEIKQEEPKISVESKEVSVTKKHKKSKPPKSKEVDILTKHISEEKEGSNAQAKPKEEELKSVEPKEETKIVEQKEEEKAEKSIPKRCKKKGKKPPAHPKPEEGIAKLSPALKPVVGTCRVEVQVATIEEPVETEQAVDLMSSDGRVVLDERPQELEVERVDDFETTLSTCDEPTVSQLVASQERNVELTKRIDSLLSVEGSLQEVITPHEPSFEEMVVSSPSKVEKQRSQLKLVSEEVKTASVAEEKELTDVQKAAIRIAKPLKLKGEDIPAEASVLSVDEKQDYKITGEKPKELSKATISFEVDEVPEIKQLGIAESAGRTPQLQEAATCEILSTLDTDEKELSRENGQQGFDKTSSVKHVPAVAKLEMRLVDIPPETGLQAVQITEISKPETIEDSTRMEVKFQKYQPQEVQMSDNQRFVLEMDQPQASFWHEDTAILISADAPKMEREDIEKSTAELVDCSKEDKALEVKVSEIPKSELVIRKFEKLETKVVQIPDDGQHLEVSDLPKLIALRRERTQEEQMQIQLQAQSFCLEDIERQTATVSSAVLEEQEISASKSVDVVDVPEMEREDIAKSIAELGTWSKEDKAKEVEISEIPKPEMVIQTPPEAKLEKQQTEVVQVSNDRQEWKVSDLPQLIPLRRERTPEEQIVEKRLGRMEDSTVQMVSLPEDQKQPASLKEIPKGTGPVTPEETKKKVEFGGVSFYNEEVEEKLMAVTGEQSKARRQKSSRPSKTAIRRQMAETSKLMEPEPHQVETVVFEQPGRSVQVIDKKKTRKRKKKDKKSLAAEEAEDEENVQQEEVVPAVDDELEILATLDQVLPTTPEIQELEPEERDISAMEQVPCETDKEQVIEQGANEEELKRWEGMLQKLDHQTQLVQRGRRQSLLPSQTKSLIPPSAREMEIRLDEVLVLLASASRGEDIQERWFVVVEMLLQWIEAIQYYVYMLEQSVDIDGRLEQYKIIVEKVGILARQIPVLQNDSSFNQCPPQIQIFITDALENMRQQTIAIDSEMRSNLQEVSMVQEEWMAYMEKVTLFETVFVETRIRFEQTLQNSASTTESAREIEKLEQELHALHRQFAELQKTGEKLLAKHPGLGINPLLSTTESSITQLHSQLRRRKEGLIRAEGLQEQYEKLLNEYQQLLDTAEVVLERDISAPSAEEIKQTADQHREFFATIHQYHCLLDSLAAVTDRVTQDRCKPLHEQLRTRAPSLLVRGLQLGHRLDCLSNKWIQLEDKVAKAEEKIASVTEPATEPTLLPQALDGQICSYLDSEFTLLKVCALITEIESTDSQLLCIIQGKPLASKIDSLRRACSTLSNSFSVVLRKLRHVKDNWQICEKMKDEMEIWLNNANHEIRQCQNHFKDALANKCLLDIKIILRFKELKCGLERENITLENFSSKLSQLNMFGLLNKKYLNNLEQRLENDYQQLENKCRYINDHFLVNLCTDSNAASLRKEFIDHGTSILEKEEVVNTANVDDVLHKCQDLFGASKEFQMSMLNEDLKEEEEEAEDWKWRNVNSKLESQIALLQSLQLIKKTLDDYVLEGENFLLDVNDKIKHLEEAKESDKHTAELALEKSKDLLVEVQNKKSLLQRIEQSKSEAGSSEIGSKFMVSVRDQHKLLEDRWKDLESSIESLTSYLSLHIDRWGFFNQVAENVSEQLRKCSYAVNQHTLAALEIEAFGAQIAELEIERTNFQNCSSSLQILSDAAKKLTTKLSCSQAELVNSIEKELKGSWEQKEKELNEQLDRMRSGLETWTKYKNEYEMLHKEMEMEEKQFEELLAKYTYLNYPDKESHVSTCKSLKSKVEKTGQKCNSLNELCRQLQSEADISHAIKLHSPGEVEYFVQKNIVLSTEIDHHCELVSNEMKEVKEFLGLLSTIDTFLDKVQKTLAEGSLTVTDERLLQETVTAVKNLLIEFSDLEPCMVNLREIHSRIRLDENVREQATLAIQSWMQLYMELLQRHHWLQMELVMASDREQRLAKCQFSVEETKNILVSPNASYADVIQQQRKVDLYQIFLENQQDMLTTQSHLLLQAIPSDQLPQAIQEVENVKFDTKEAIHAANICLQNLGSHVYLWQTYKHLHDKLAYWLKSLEREKLQLRLKHTPIKKVEKILKRLEILLANMTEGETLLSDLESSSRALIEKSDDQTTTILRSEVSRLQQRLNNVNAGLATWQQFLQRVWHLWKNVESSVGDLHNQLVNTRQLLITKIPNRRIHLIEQQQLCLQHIDQLKEIESKLEELKDHEQELIESIAPSDMKLLHHRVHLLRQLWNGTEHELQERLHQLALALDQWENFDQRLQAFERWIDEMETKLDDKQEMFVEDLITKLETSYRIEMDEKAEEFSSLVALGENLMASEEKKEQKVIENRLANVRTRWRSLVDLRAQKLNTLSDILELLRQFEDRLGTLAKWLRNIELELNTPVVFQRFSIAEVDEKLDEAQNIARLTDSHTNDVRSVLELCQRLKENCKACTTEGDVTAVEQAAEHFKRRWERVNELMNLRRQKLERTREFWESLHSNCNRFSKWLTTAEGSASFSPQIQELSFEEAKTQLQNNKAQQKNIEHESQILSEINRQYRDLARSGSVDQSGSMLEQVKNLNSIWDRIRHPIQDNLLKNQSFLMSYLHFITVHQETLNWLADLNEQLSNIEHFSDDSPDEKLDQVRLVSDVLEQQEVRLIEVNKAGREIAEQCPLNSTAVIGEHLNEFNGFCSDLNSRLERLRKEFAIAVEQKVAEAKKPAITLEINGSTTSDPEAVNSGPTEAHLLTALSETNERLSCAETSLRSPTPVIFKTEKPPEGYSLQLALCKSSIDLVQHLLDQDPGLSRLQAIPLDVKGVMERWTVVEVEAMEKERRLKDAYKQWCQLMKDLTSMEKWLTKAETHDLQMPMDSWNHLETAVQSYKDFLVDVDSHKSTVLALNLTVQNIVDKDNTSDSRQLQDRIKKINNRWEDICRNAVARQSQLHTALLHCHEFEETLADVQRWLELTEDSVRQLEPVDLTAERTDNQIKYDGFLKLRPELEAFKQRIAFFQDAASQLVIHSNSEESRRTKDELDKLSARLDAILHVCNTYIDMLERFFESDPTVKRIALDQPAISLSKQFFEDRTGTEPQSTDKRDSEEGDDALTRCRQFVSRVLRTALPIQALMLIVLGMASLVPVSEQDYSCSLVNNFARSFQPMLHYTDGPPPV